MYYFTIRSTGIYSIDLLKRGHVCDYLTCLGTRDGKTVNV